MAEMIGSTTTTTTTTLFFSAVVVASTIVTLGASAIDVAPNLVLPNIFEMNIEYRKRGSIYMHQSLAWDDISNRCTTHFNVSSQFPTTMTQVSRYDLGYFLQSVGNSLSTFQCQNLSLTGHVSNFWGFPDNRKYIGIGIVNGVQCRLWQWPAAQATAAATAVSGLVAVSAPWPSMMNALAANVNDIVQFAMRVDTSAPWAMTNLNTSAGYSYLNWRVGIPPLSAFVVPELVTHPSWKCPSSSSYSNFHNNAV